MQKAIGIECVYCVAFGELTVLYHIEKIRFTHAKSVDIITVGVVAR